MSETGAPEPPAPPERSFASDNTAGVCPAVMDAISRIARGSAPSYGDDALTRAARNAFDELFERRVETLFCWGGTGANVVGLASVLQPWHSVITPASAHIVVDECGAPARFTGASISAVPTAEGKLRPADIEPFLHMRGSEHHPQPRVISISQATETGRLYSIDEIGSLCDFAHRNDLLVHLDGARIGNAVAALGCSVSELLGDTGVDVMTFGLTKNGAMYGEAVIFLRADLATNARFVRKQAGQLASKGRYIAAQALALLEDDLWLTNASHANAMAGALYSAASKLDGVLVEGEPQVNAVFARLPRAAITAAQNWSFFWDWDADLDLVRWMTSFETTPEDVRRFVAGVEYFVASV